MICRISKSVPHVLLLVPHASLFLYRISSLSCILERSGEQNPQWPSFPSLSLSPLGLKSTFSHKSISANKTELSFINV